MVISFANRQALTIHAAAKFRVERLGRGTDARATQQTERALLYVFCRHISSRGPKEPPEMCFHRTKIYCVSGLHDDLLGQLCTWLTPVWWHTKQGRPSAATRSSHPDGTGPREFFDEYVRMPTRCLFAPNTENIVAHGKKAAHLVGRKPHHRGGRWSPDPPLSVRPDRIHSHAMCSRIPTKVKGGDRS